MNGAIEGIEMEKRQCRRDEKYKGKKGTRKCRWRIFRFGELSFLDLEVGIQFGSP